MTQKELELISADNSELLEYLDAEEDVKKIMQIVLEQEKDHDKILNLLFYAITKAFALGYYRGSRSSKLS